MYCETHMEKCAMHETMMFHTLHSLTFYEFYIKNRDKGMHNSLTKIVVSYGESGIFILIYGLESSLSHYTLIFNCDIK